MKIEVQIVIKEIVWKGDTHGYVSRKLGTHRAFKIKMWESQSLKGLINDHLEKETGHRPESWSFHRCFIVGGNNE